MRPRLQGWGLATTIAYVTTLALLAAQNAAGASTSSDTYSNLVSTALLERAQEASRALAAEGLLPVESFTNAVIELEGQSTHPSGRVRGSRCEYGFRQGLIESVRRMDLFEDKGPASLILTHLTNEVLKLPTTEAAGRAVRVLQLLSYPTNQITPAYKFSVHEDLMDAYPLRNAGPDFPKELHFFGELISKKKIKVTVSITPNDPRLITEWGYALTATAVEFLATTGELLNATFLPDGQAIARLKLVGPKQITIGSTPDFAAPIFVSSTRRLSREESLAPAIRVESVVRELWQDFQQKLGTNRAQCLLVCDNLNDPRAVANAIGKLAGSTPWAGVSHEFRLDLPFDRGQVERLASDKRGISLLGVCGAVDTRFAAFPDQREAGNKPTNEELATPAGQARWKQFYDEEHQRLAPSIEQLLGKIDLPLGLPDHALFLLQAAVSSSSHIVEEQLQSRLRGQAQVCSVMGPSDHWSMGDGLTYFNGQLLTNGMVVFCLNGWLPLDGDVSHRLALHVASMTNSPNFDPEKLRLLQTRGPARIISGEVINPVRQLAYAFGPHPLEDVLAFFGGEGIKILQESEKLEVFEVKPNHFGTTPPAGAALIEGYEMVAQGKTLTQESAHEFASALLTEKNGIRTLSGCMFQPVVVFRAWRGQEHTSLTVCFQCNECVFASYDRTGKRIKQTYPFFFAGRPDLLRLARQGLPTSATLVGIN